MLFPSHIIWNSKPLLLYIMQFTVFVLLFYLIEHRWTLPAAAIRMAFLKTLFYITEHFAPTLDLYLNLDLNTTIVHLKHQFLSQLAPKGWMLNIEWEHLLKAIFYLFTPFAKAFCHSEMHTNPYTCYINSFLSTNGSALSDFAVLVMVQGASPICTTILYYIFTKPSSLQIDSKKNYMRVSHA